MSAALTEKQNPSVQRSRSERSTLGLFPTWRIRVVVSNRDLSKVHFRCSAVSPKGAPRFPIRLQAFECTPEFFRFRPVAVSESRESAARRGDRLG
jgi:hypothetical protein